MGFEHWLLGVPLRAQPLGYSPVLFTVIILQKPDCFASLLW
jgi:hypothetical protein